MNTKKLLVSVGVIFIIAGGLYTIVAPRATRVLDGDMTPAPVVNTAPVVTADATTTVVTPTQAPAPIVTPTPTPASQPAPVLIVDPAPTPAPAPTTSSYTSAEVAMHNSDASCWSIVNESVYDLTSYISKHPGGEREILRICGKDGSSSFEGQHGGESRPERTLANYWIGDLR